MTSDGATQISPPQGVGRRKRRAPATATATASTAKPGGDITASATPTTTHGATTDSAATSGNASIPRSARSGPRRRGSGPRAHNRRREILDAAARLFAQRGFHAGSMREIAAAAGMLPGSLYYHFPSKDELLLAVYGDGVRRIAECFDAALKPADLPWARFEAACVAHLEMLLEAGGDYAQVVIRVRPEDCPAMAPQLVALRDAHEDRFKALIAALDLPEGFDRQALRLMVLGALNWTQTWYRPGGDPPATIARRFLTLVAGALDADPPDAIAQRFLTLIAGGPSAEEMP